MRRLRDDQVQARDDQVQARHVLLLWALVYAAVFAFLWTIASGCAGPRVLYQGEDFDVEAPADSL